MGKNQAQILLCEPHSLETSSHVRGVFIAEAFQPILAKETTDSAHQRFPVPGESVGLGPEHKQLLTSQKGRRPDNMCPLMGDMPPTTIWPKGLGQRPACRQCRGPRNILSPRGRSRQGQMSEALRLRHFCSLADHLWEMRMERKPVD